MRSTEQQPANGNPKPERDGCVACVVSILGFTLVLALKLVLPAESAAMSQPWLPAAPSSDRFDPSPYILNALFVPALDADALPLRWVDPRPVMACGPDAEVLVNGEPLQPGAMVPAAAFEMEWQTDGCRPFGLGGPSFTGSVRMTIFREDWGFSAMIEPSSLRVGLAESERIEIPRVATLPRSADAGEFAESLPPGTD